MDAFPPPRDGVPLIEAEGLTRRFGDLVAVDGISLAVAPGETLGFLGPNGAGKTTTMKMLVGLLRPSAGAARIGGHDVWTAPRAAKALLGYVPDVPSLPEHLTAREILAYVAGLYRVERVEAAARGAALLARFGLTERADDVVDGFSHGMRQKVALAAALLPRPRALFLDEPTVGLDPRSARTIKDVLRDLAADGAAVMLSTHILEIAEALCDRVAIVDEGRLVALGTVSELRERADLSGSLEEVFLRLTERDGPDGREEGGAAPAAGTP